MLHAGVVVNVHLAFARLAFFGGHEYHAVGGARAVNGRCRRVLQHLNRGNVVGVDVGQCVELLVARADVGVATRVDGHPVHYVQRVAARRNRVVAPNPHRYAAAGSAGVLRHLHARSPALQYLVEAGHRLAFKLLGVYRRYRAGYQRPVLGAVAHHHNFVELLGVLSQGGVHGRFAANGPLLRYHAHRAKRERAAGLGHRQAIRPVGIGRHPGSSSFQQYRDAWQSTACGLFCHPTRHRTRLRHGSVEKSKHEHEAHE